MSFSSVTFIFFYLPIVFIGYFALQKLFPKIVEFYLLAISFLFYAWADKKTAVVFLLCSIVIYLLGWIIQKRRSRLILAVTIAMLAAVLVYFKYANYSISIINRVFNREIDQLYLILPLGISFSAFESISYVVDVYKGTRRGNIIEYLLFIFFFPKVCSGPIVTWRVFEKELVNRKSSLEKTVTGIEKTIVGLGKKVIIADVLGSIVLTVTTNYHNADSLSLWLCAFCYMLQLYFDFSGYSDMAVGIADIFGFSFAKNFDYPYLSKSVGEFFRRWHISLGNFLKQYVYIPLGGNRSGNVYVNLFIVFLVSGLWHGDSISYIIWGVLIGLAVCLERYLAGKRFYRKIPAIIKWIITMIFIYFTWILFMMPDFSSVVSYVKRMFMMVSPREVGISYRYYFDNRIVFTMISGALASLFGYISFNAKTDLLICERNRALAAKYILLVVLFVCSVIVMINSNYSPFLYFKF